MFKVESASSPRKLECELTEDLVKTCIPGDDVTVTGIIKVIFYIYYILYYLYFVSYYSWLFYFQVRNPLTNNAKNKQNTIFTLYLQTISICNSKKQNVNSSPSEGVTFNTNDYYLIKVRIYEMFASVWHLSYICRKFIQNLSYSSCWFTHFVQIFMDMKLSKLGCYLLCLAEQNVIRLERSLMFWWLAIRD